MVRKSPGDDSKRSAGFSLRPLHIVLGTALLVVVAGIFHELALGRHTPAGGSRGDSEASATGTSTRPSPPPPWISRTEEQALRRPTPPPAEERPPWEPMPPNTPALPPGFLPAYSVNPIRPQADVPPPPKEPANPIVNLPPAQNPGGVEGNRGPRPDAIYQRRMTNGSRAAIDRRGEDGNARIRLRPDNDDSTRKPAEQ